MSAKNLSGYEVGLAAPAVNVGQTCAVGLSVASNLDLELIIAHLLGRNDSGAHLDPDVRNALVHERYADAVRLIRSRQ